MYLKYHHEHLLKVIVQLIGQQCHNGQVFDIDYHLIGINIIIFICR